MSKYTFPLWGVDRNSRANAFFIKMPFANLCLRSQEDFPGRQVIHVRPHPSGPDPTVTDDLTTEPPPTCLKDHLPRPLRAGKTIIEVLEHGIPNDTTQLIVLGPGMALPLFMDTCNNPSSWRHILLFWEFRKRSARTDPHGLYSHGSLAQPRPCTSTSPTNKILIPPSSFPPTLFFPPKTQCHKHSLGSWMASAGPMHSRSRSTL